MAPKVFRAITESPQTKVLVSNVLINFSPHQCLGDLAIVIETKENAVQTNQESTLLLESWPRTIIIKQ